MVKFLFKSTDATQNAEYAQTLNIAYNVTEIYFSAAIFVFKVVMACSNFTNQMAII